MANYIEYIIYAVIAVYILWSSVKVLKPNQRAVIFRFGRLHVAEPGIKLLMPFVDKYFIVDLDKMMPGWQGFHREEVNRMVEFIFVNYPEVPVNLSASDIQKEMQAHATEERAASRDAPEPKPGMANGEVKVTREKPSIRKRVGRVSEDLWVFPQHSERRRFDVAMLILLLLGLVLFITIDVEPLAYVVLAGLASPAFYFLLVKRVTEIDRKQGTINKRWQLFHVTRNEISSLSSFDTAYLSLSYTRGYVLVLYGPNSSIEVLFTTDKDKANRYARDLADFLNFRLEDTVS